MKVLLDTNIIIDVISRRDGYKNSLQVLRYCETNRFIGFVSTTTVTDTMYILRKHISQPSVRDSLQTLLLIIDVADVIKGDILYAFNCPMKDFEDAVQSSCAKRNKADYIITNNINDFKESIVPAITPPQALNLLKH
jgi:predicted nucleic acid-binding protein